MLLGGRGSRGRQRDIGAEEGERQDRRGERERDRERREEKDRQSRTGTEQTGTESKGPPACRGRHLLAVRVDLITAEALRGLALAVCRLCTPA